MPRMIQGHIEINCYEADVLLIPEAASVKLIGNIQVLPEGSHF